MIYKIICLRAKIMSAPLFMSLPTREPTKTSIHRNVDTPDGIPSCGLHTRGVVLISCPLCRKPSPYRDSVKHYSSRADSSQRESRILE